MQATYSDERPYLLDENLARWWRRALVRLAPDLQVWRVGDPDAPPLKSHDPSILDWCEEHDFVLVTNNRKSLPRHVADHLARGRHVPGIFVVDPTADLDTLIGELTLIAGASFEGEYRDQIRYLPMS